jgi:hypothetical protein
LFLLLFHLSSDLRVLYCVFFYIALTKIIEGRTHYET